MAGEDGTRAQLGPGSGESANGARLMHLPERVRAHPLFRRGYNLGYSDRAHEEHLAGTTRNDPRPPDGGTPRSPAWYGVDTGDLRDRLTAGDQAVRELPAADRRGYATEIPCCGRPITVPATADEPSAAACCRCRILYTVAVVEEEPDGYNDEPLKVALLTVGHVNAATARHRAGRWEQPLGPR